MADKSPTPSSDYVLSRGLSEDKLLVLQKDGGFVTWDSKQLGKHLEEVGLGDYKESMEKHKITGRIAPLLSDQDLRDMGMNIVGDRLRFKQILLALGRKSRFQSRSRSLWQGTEQIYSSPQEEQFLTCCGACPDDPSTYNLTSNYIKIKTVKPTRCFGWKMCCCPYEYSVNNVDLTHVVDVDVVGMPAPGMQRVCCCAKGKDMVEVSTANTQSTGSTGANNNKLDAASSSNKIILVVKGGDGEQVSELIMNQVEEAQVMERD